VLRYSVPLEQVKDEVIGTLRGMRGLGPRDDNDFALIESAAILSLFNRFTAMIFLGSRLHGFTIGLETSSSASDMSRLLNRHSSVDSQKIPTMSVFWVGLLVLLWLAARGATPSITENALR